MHTPTITYLAAWATAATALGTIVLAAATYWLARKTKETAEAAGKELAESTKQSAAMAEQTRAVSAQADAIKEQAAATTEQVELLKQSAEAAKRQSDAAEAALNASIQPLITDVPVPTMIRVPPTDALVLRMRHQAQPPQVASEIDGSRITAGTAGAVHVLVVPVRNVGSGAARLRRAALSHAQVMVPPMYVYSTPPSIVASYEIVRIVFSAKEEPHPGWMDLLLGSDEPLMVEVSYTDVAGRQEAVTQLTLRKVGDPPYMVSAVELFATPRLTDLPASGSRSSGATPGRRRAPGPS